MTKAQPKRREKEIDKDTVVAYHEFIQGRIQSELNGVGIGPGHFLCKLAVGIVVFGFVCLLVGILVISLRHRHVYLWDWNSQFVGPFFVIMFLLCCSFATFLFTMARRRTNQYRHDLSFRPIGDYGVAVVHKSKLNYDEKQKTELKSGTTPHNIRHPGRPGVNDRGNRGGYSRSGYDSRGYSKDRDGDDYYNRRRDEDRPDRGERRDRDRDDRRRDDRGRRPEGDRRRPPEEDRRRRDDRDRGERGERRRDDGGERRVRTPEEEKRREEHRRKYEEEKRRRYEEDRRRAQLRKQAEADGLGQNVEAERGVDVGGRQVMVTTKVRITEEPDESSI